MRNAAIEAVRQLARKDKNIILMSGDLGFGVLDSFRTEMPQQYFNVGICEQNMAAMAAGMALEGKKVYIYSIGNFPTLRCTEQIRNDICYHNANVTIMAVGGGFAYGSLGMSHHATEDIAVMRSLPNMKVFIPADAIEAREIVYKSAELNAPCYIRLNKGGEPDIHQSLEEMIDYQIGKAFLLRRGKDVCLMATGAITAEAMKAAEGLENRAIQASVYSFPSVKPIDTEVIKVCAKRYKYIYTVEEHNIIGGFGSAVSEILAEEGAGCRLLRIGLPDVYSGIVGEQAYLRHQYHMDSQAIEEKVMETIH
ncbi:transketolase C-terminal domain-containing protein [Lachnospiraceae bacterium 54-11]